IREEVCGVIAIYSNRRFHYSKREEQMLESLTSAVGIVVDQMRSLGVFKEKQDLVHRISTQLHTFRNLEELFKQVIDSVLMLFKSEEAALFVAEPAAEGKSNLIRRVAVAANDEKVAEQLRAIEAEYPDDESFGEQRFPTSIPESI